MVLKKKAESIFSSGTDVEVNIKKDNLRDAWFPAIVIKENEDDTFIVKCQSSRNGDEAGVEKITVDLLHIRPHPPHPPVNKRYDVLEKVDAFWDFAWRPGVIVKLFTDTRYLVFFKLANENKIINQSEIRPHVEWKDGKWDRGSEVWSLPLYGGNEFRFAIVIVGGILMLLTNLCIFFSILPKESVNVMLPFSI